MTDEIEHLMCVFGKFRYSKLSTVGKRLLKEGLEEQRHLTDKMWSVFRCLNRTEAVTHPLLTLVLANSSHWKLSSREVIVLDEQNVRFLLPYRKAEDFFAFAALLKIESLWGYATLAFCIQPTSYEFEKLSPPQQICNEADADVCEFEFLEEYQPYTQGITSLWRGSGAAGGTLFTLTLDLQQIPPFMKFTYIE